MKELDIIKQLFDKYKISSHLPVEAKKHILISRKRVLIKVLKDHGKYPFYMLAVVSVFFWFKKLGITLSLAKSALVAFLITMTVAAAFGTGSYYVIDHILADDNIQIEKLSDELEIKKSEPLKKKTISKKVIEKSKPLKIDYKLNIIPFDSEGVKKTLVNKIASKINNNLLSIKGASASKVISRNRKNISSKKVLIGSIVKLDDTHLVTVKIMNPVTSKVLLYVTEEFKSDIEINGMCKRIAVKVAAKL